MKKTKRLKMRGIPRRLLVDYFSELAETAIEDKYFGKFWEVTVLPEYHQKTGAILINCVEIEMAVEISQFDDFLFQFRKNFLRGGG